jgi:thiol:disulfide interchange protein DsbD
MKNLILSIVSLLAVVSLDAQPAPVKWTFEANRVQGQEYELTFTALVNDGWYIYSQHLDEGGPIPTSFTFQESDHYALLGRTEEEGSHRQEGMDELFGMNVVKYGERVVFKQRIRVSDASRPVEGQLEFMTCDDNRCLPPRTVNFRIPLP